MKCIDVFAEKLPNFIAFVRGLIAKYKVDGTEMVDGIDKLEKLMKTNMTLAYTELCSRLDSIDNIDELLAKEYGDLSRYEAADLDKLKRYFELFKTLAA